MQRSGACRLAVATVLGCLGMACLASLQAADGPSGPWMVRRLNRREYVNTIRDLFGIETTAEGLPPDAAPVKQADGRATGYDTFGGTAAVTADGFARYLAAARGVVATAISDMRLAAAPPPRRTVRVEPERESPRREEIAEVAAVVNAHQRRMLDLERWRRAGESPDFLPLGLTSVEAAKQAVEAVRKPDAKFLEAASRLSRPRAAEGWYLDPAPRSEGDDGSRFAVQYPRITLPPDLPPGTYVVRVKAALAVERVPGPNGGVTFNVASPRLRFIELCSARPRTEPDRDNDFRSGPTEIAVVGHHDVSGSTYLHSPPQIIEFAITVRPGSPRHYFVREKTHADPRFDAYRTQEELRASGSGPVPSIWIDWIAWEGPMPRPQVAASLRKLLGLPDPKPVPQKPGEPKPAEPSIDIPKEADPTIVRPILERFATRAFHGAKPDAAFVDRLLETQQARLKAGDDLLGSLVEPLAMVLAAPEFVYVQGPAPPAAPASPATAAAPKPTGAAPADVPAGSLLSDAELAARLSYFLCASLPDDQLIAAVEAGRIRDPNQLSGQALRLARDPRAVDFSQAFVEQWLGLDELGRKQFDFKLHPAFDETTRQAARAEVGQTFQTMLKENLDARMLLASDFVVINSLLGDYYGFPVQASGRQPLTGTAFRKVPVPKDGERGGLLGMAGIVALGGDDPTAGPVTQGAWVLQRLLEEPAQPGTPPSPRLETSAQYRELAAARGDVFLRGLIENLYEYALGRPRRADVADAIDGLVTAAKADGGGLTNIVKRLVVTPGFRSR